MIDSRFVGAVNNTATPYCAVYVLLLNSLGYSNNIAVLPLTIDRAVAVILPLFVWLSIFVVLINYLVDFKSGRMVAEYSRKYHRCILAGKTYDMEDLFLLIIPFVLILLMYATMFSIIIKSKRPCGRILLLSVGIVGTNMLCSTPTVIANLGTVPMSYMLTQVLYVTVWYMNGIFNPLIYFLSHPKTKDYFRSSFILAKLGR